MPMKKVRESVTLLLRMETEMVFDARTAAVELQAACQPFPFVGLDGVHYELPNTQLMTGMQLSRLMQGDDTVIRELNDEAFHAIREMPTGVGEKLAEAWLEFSGEVGKEPTPSPVPPSDGSPSKATSPSEDSTSTT
jgi:hypothetical protein